MRIQHNIPAMNSYRNYTNNVNAVNKNLEKLSSGYKINRAGDDAAGLAISEKMRAQITGLQTAQKNAKDGISLVKTAEGALQEVHDMLNRMVTLATQSANGTYDNETDRYQLQKEVDQLKTEINRIADSSNFNGIKLLDGSMDGAGKFAMSGAINTGKAMSFNVIQDGQQSVSSPAAGVYTIDFSGFNITNNATTAATVGFDVAEGVTASVAFSANATMDGAQFATKLAAALDDVAGSAASATKGDKKIMLDGNTYSISVNGSKLVLTMDEIPTSDVETNFTGQFSSPDVGAWETAAFTTNGAQQLQVTPEVEAVTRAGRAYAQASFLLVGDKSKSALQLDGTKATYSDLDGKAILIGDTTYVFATTAASKERFGAVSGAKVIDFTDKAAGTTIDSKLIASRLAKAAENNSYFKVGANVGEDGTITLTEKEGAIDYSVNNLAGKDGKALENGASTKNDATASDWLGLVKAGTGSVTTSSGAASLSLQIGDTSDKYNQMKVNIQDCHAAAMGIGDLDISSQSAAQSAIDKIKSAINYVSDVRGTLGATQNRLDHTINNLSVMAENIQDAESTIRDTDIAEEMMAYTKNNILVQSAQAMLAQANQIPQGVLQLLG